MKPSLIAAVLLLVPALAFSACGGGGSSDGPEPPEPPPQTVPPDILAMHDQDLAATVPSCQATDCHSDQMTRYAPHRDADGNQVETFHYMKASALSGIYFGGRPPEEFADQDCTVCHKRVKLLIRSGGNSSGSVTHLRRMVDVEFCATCHGPSGPGKPLYVD